MVYLLKPPSVPSASWAQLRHAWTKFAEGAAHAVVELPLSDTSRRFVELQARRNPTSTHISVMANFIPNQAFWDEVQWMLKQGKRAIAEEETDLVFRRGPMEPDLTPRARPGRAIRIYAGKYPRGKHWWGKYTYQYYLPLYFDGDPGAPGYKLALGRLLPIFWPGQDFPSGRTIRGTHDGDSKATAAVRWQWHVNDWAKWANGKKSIFFA